MPPEEKVEIFVEEEFWGVVDEGWVRKIAQQVLKAEGVAPPLQP